MSNIEIVSLNACFLQVFEVKRVKNNKYMKKALGKKQMFMCTKHILLKKA